MPEFPGAPFRAALADLSRWLEAEDITGIIIGGVAASVLGRPRLTHDIDALAIVPETEWEGVILSAAGYGIEPRIDDALEFAQRSRVLLMRHVASGIDLDITFGGLPFEQSAVNSASLHIVGGISLRLPFVPSELLVLTGVLVGFGAGPLYCFAEYVYTQGSYDNRRVNFSTPWTGHKVVNWSDLYDIGYSDYGRWYVFKFRGGERIRLSTMLGGVDGILRRFAGLRALLNS